MARKLRIAVSVFFGLLAVALCVLWVRSYHFADVLCRHLLVSSEQGEINVSWNDDGTATGQWMYSRIVVPWNPSNKSYLPQPSPPFGWSYNQHHASARFPHWSAMLAAAGFAAVPWFRPRFSLRTVLIVTTLVAMVLGLVVWAGR